MLFDTFNTDKEDVCYKINPEQCNAINYINLHLPVTAPSVPAL